MNDPVHILLAGLLLVHLAEGLLYVRRHALVFVRGRRNKAARAQMGSGSAGFVWVGPLPPFGEVFVTSTWPVAVGQDALLTQPAQVLGKLTPEPAQLVPFETMGRVVSEANAVVSGRQELAKMSGPISAQILARHLEQLRTTRPKARADVLRKIMKARHDVERAKKAQETFRRASRWVPWFTSLQFVLICCGVPAFFFVPAFFAWWLPWVSAILAVHLCLFVVFWRAHRRLYPDARGDRVMRTLILTINPLAGLRVGVWLARAVWADVHPLAAAQCHLREQGVAKLFGLVVRDLAHAPPADDPEQEVLGMHREVAAKVTRDFAKKHKLDYEAAASTEPEEASKYCPRCLETYLESSTQCEDCLGLGLAMSSSKAQA